MFLIVDRIVIIASSHQRIIASSSPSSSHRWEMGGGPSMEEGRRRKGKSWTDENRSVGQEYTYGTEPLPSVLYCTIRYNYGVHLSTSTEYVRSTEVRRTVGVPPYGDTYLRTPYTGEVYPEADGRLSSFGMVVPPAPGIES